MKGTVLALVKDIYFKSLIEGACKANGLECIFVLNEQDLNRKINAQREKPIVCVVDLNAENTTPLEIGKHVHAQGIPVFAYAAHIQTEKLNGARSAGFEWVVPKSVFAKLLAERLRALTKVP
ncbi:MAG: hypothetical protein HY393_03330 [Candidatus Diapherotrites archaeon]|nr:hypothetical protein [Candidatus Diapherotrites archaeon]